MSWLSVVVLWGVALIGVGLIYGAQRLRVFAFRQPQEAGLTGAERRAAYSAAVRGRTVTNPRLAPAAYASALLLQERLTHRTRLPYRIFLRCLAALLVIVGLFEFGTTDAPNAVSNLFAAVFVIVAQVIQLRSLRRVWRALDLNGPLLPTPHGDPRSSVSHG